METLKRILKRIFCLPPLCTLIVSFFGYGFVLAVMVLKIQNPILQHASYIVSAYALTVTVTGLVYIHKISGGVRKIVSDHPFMKKFRSTEAGEKFLTDVHFRAVVSLYQGFIINFIYIIIKLVSGILYRSAWFIALAIYYFLLALMRLLLIWRVNIQDERSKLRRYRLCGIMLLFMNQALAGIVIFMVHQNKGFNYPGMLIYAMALYAFYAVILAIINVVKTRHHNSPILSAAKMINLVAAMVSILSLETAMLAEFGGNDGPIFRKTMTATTGAGVCIIVFGMAVYMIWRSNKELKKFNFNNS